MHPAAFFVPEFQKTRMSRRRQTRRRLRGRHPLWGMPVWSSMAVTLMPLAWSAVMADSRPKAKTNLRVVSLDRLHQLSNQQRFIEFQEFSKDRPHEGSK